MSFFPWKEEYCTGIRKFDEQHKILVGLLNELYEAMHSGKGKDALEKVLSGLLQYTKTHFSAEEALMKMYDYPGYPEHRDKHEKMTGHVLGLVAKLQSGEIASPIQISNFLKDWLARHIMETDRAYGPFLKTKGVI